MPLTRPTCDYLYAYYLRNETAGEQGEFNHRFFPKLFKEMVVTLRELELTLHQTIRQE